MVEEKSPASISVVFYRNLSGAEPVRDWLKAMELADRRAIGQDLERVQFRWPVGMPICRAMGAGLWEVRVNLSGHRVARILFCSEDGGLVLLHGFIKKTQKTPSTDLDLARKRLTEVATWKTTRSSDRR